MKIKYITGILLAIFLSGFAQETDLKKDTKLWSKYNFVPGDEIIFIDDLKEEENGEFPSRWDLLSGTAENAIFGEEKVVNILNRAMITPLMENTSYLPEVFTIEFDVLFKRTHGPTYQDYYINLWPGTGKYGYSEDRKSYCGSIVLNMHGAYLTCKKNGSTNEYKFYDKSMVVAAGQPVWRHVAIAFNKRNLKLFLDEKRILNIPNLAYKPEAFVLGLFANYKEALAIKNIRIAEGGKKLYDQILKEGRFVTRGILFDVNQATIKLESMGVINQVANLMKEHTELKFDIVGHTDAQGEDDYNLELSKKRAEAVMKAILAKGITSERLKATGMGEKIPMADNATPEGRANNRRVEFVKMGNF